jgi:signal transduction histidine kinase
MAREIHDTLAQSFTGILAQVGAAKQVLTDDLEAAQAHLDLIKELARTGLTEARRSVCRAPSSAFGGGQFTERSTSSRRSNQNCRNGYHFIL